MEASYKMTFPASRSCLWCVYRINLHSHADIMPYYRDNSATDERVDLHLTSSQ